MIRKILFVIVTVFAVSSCGQKSGSRVNIVGNTFINENGTEKQIVGFDENNVYFKWDDSLGQSSFKTAYKVASLNDSTLNIELTEKNPYMSSNIWTIIVDQPDGFYTMDSKKRYKLYKSK